MQMLSSQPYFDIIKLLTQLMNMNRNKALRLLNKLYVALEQNKVLFRLNCVIFLSDMVKWHIVLHVILIGLRVVRALCCPYVVLTCVLCVKPTFSVVVE